MTSEITQTTLRADCCNGPTNCRSKRFETRPRENYFDRHEKCKNRLKTGSSVY